MKYLGMLAAGLLFIPLAGCSHETTPDEAMQAMATGLANNKPEAYWDGLPPSYQQDVAGLIREFAGKMDPEIWNKGLSAAKNLVQVLDEKREYIQQNPMLVKYIDVQLAQENWDDAVQALSILIKSDAADLDKLKTLDVQDFLSTTGSDLMEHLPAVVAITKLKMLENIMQEYKAAQFKLVEMDGDTAKIAIELPNKETDLVPMVKVEGKWIPQEMANSWASDMQQARTALADFDLAQNADEKKQILANLQMADSYLKLLKDSKSAEEFNGKVGVIAMMLAMSGGGGQTKSISPASFHQSEVPPPVSLKSGKKAADARLPEKNLPDDNFSAEPLPDRASPAGYAAPAGADSAAE